ncbi:MAG: FG-GAP-like repeat-containing protein [Limnobacter sp.]
MILFGMLVSIAQPFAMMNTPTKWDVGATGELNYDVAVRVPPGVAGVQPSVKLSYNSQFGNGILGVGWSLDGLSAITRCPSIPAADGVRGAITMSSSDRLCMDGQRLILQTGTYGADGATYATEVYNGARIVGTSWTGSLQTRTFKVYTKAGELMEFVPFSTPAGDIAIQFVLSRVTDAKGNYWQAYYHTNTAKGEIYPKAICYTGNSNLNQLPKNCVEFGYGSESNRFGPAVERTDLMTSFTAGYSMRIAKKISGVRTLLNAAISPVVSGGDSTWSVSGTTVTEYRLFSRASTLTGRSLITKLVECDGANKCLPELGFNWLDSTETKGWIATPTIHPPFAADNSSQGNLKAVVMDINGDGLTDFIYHRVYRSTSTSPTVYKGAYISNGSGWTNVPGYIPPLPVAIDARGDVGARFADVNGDGLVDFLYHRHADSNNITAYLNTGSGWAATPTPALAPPFHVVTDTLFDLGARFLDVNGDGRVDEIYHRAHGGGVQAGAYLSTGTGWTMTAGYAPPYHISADGLGDLGVRFVDLNGDGLPDFVYHRVVSDGSIQKGAYLNSGTGWVFDDRFTPPYHIHVDSIGDVGVRFVDLNGDGLQDMIYSRSYSGLTQDGAYFNTGTGWLSAPGFKPPVHFSQDGLGDLGTKLVDINADGLVDILYSRKTSGVVTAKAYVNTGTGWKEMTAYNLPYPMFIDGEGLTETYITDTDGDDKPNYSHAHLQKGSASFDLGAFRLDLSRDLIGSVTVDGRSDISGAMEAEYLHYSALRMKNQIPVGSRDYPILPISPPVMMVSATRSHSGYGTQAPVAAQADYAIALASSGGKNTVNYTYGAPKVDIVSGRGFLGFEWMEGRPVGADGYSHVYGSQSFMQKWPCQGMSTANRTKIPIGGFTSESVSTLAVKVLGQNTVLECGASGLNGKSVIPYASETVVKQWELTPEWSQGVALPGKKVTTSVDVYGNPLQITEQTLNADGTQSGYSTTTVNTYDADATRARQGRLIKSTVTHVKP